MLPEAFLLANAQIAVAAITVAGILGLLRNQGSKKLTAPELTGIRFMIEHAIVALFMSYLPVVLFYYLGSAPRAMSIASAGFALALVILQLLAVRKLMAIKPRRPLVLLFGWFLPTLLVTLLLGYNVLNTNAGNYCVGLVWVLSAFCVQLLHFTFPPNAPTA